LDSFEDVTCLGQYRLYVAMDREKGEKVVIKFVERYREEAHLVRRWDPMLSKDEVSLSAEFSLLTPDLE